MNLRQITLRQIAALLGTTADVVHEAERMVARIDRKQRSAVPLTIAVLALAGVGVAALTIAVSPDVRRKLRDTLREWLAVKEAQPADIASSSDAMPIGETPTVDADMAEAYANGARP